MARVSPDIPPILSLAGCDLQRNSGIIEESMRSGWFVALVLLFTFNADAAHAQRASRSALAYRGGPESRTGYQVVHLPDSVKVKSHKTRNVLIGMAVGAAVGGSTAYFLARRNCDHGRFVCDDPAPVIFPTVLFSVVGGLGGGVVVHHFSRSRGTPDARPARHAP